MYVCGEPMDEYSKNGLSGIRSSLVIVITFFDAFVFWKRTVSTQTLTHAKRKEVDSIENAYEKTYCFAGLVSSIGIVDVYWGNRKTL